MMAQSNMLLVTRALRFPKDNIHLVSCTMPKRRKVKTCPKTCWIYRRGKPSNEALSLNVIVIIGNPYLLFHPGNTSILQFYGISLSKAGFATTEPSKDLAARPNTFFLEPWYVKNPWRSHRGVTGLCTLLTGDGFFNGGMARRHSESRLPWSKNFHERQIWHCSLLSTTLLPLWYLVLRDLLLCFKSRWMLQYYSLCRPVICCTGVAFDSTT
jgi:hypothetical protein